MHIYSDASINEFNKTYFQASVYPDRIQEWIRSGVRRTKVQIDTFVVPLPPARAILPEPFHGQAKPHMAVSRA